MTLEITVEELRERRALAAQRKAHFEALLAAQGGRLSNGDGWRATYAHYPYLLAAPDERVAERFRHIMVNQMELSEEGKLGMLPIDVNSEGFTQRFTHLLEEFGFRGGTNVGVAQNATATLSRYFEGDGPIAKRMFAKYARPTGPILVKYGRVAHLERMYSHGTIRVSPASYYGSNSLNFAIKDDEITRSIYVPTFDEFLDGQMVKDINGIIIPLTGADIEGVIKVPDYYLYSLCDHIYYRLPTDFDADAAIIIRNPDLFIQRVAAHLLLLFPDWEVRYGPVNYYDPYRTSVSDAEKFSDAEMTKHFGYSYQREVRLTLRPKVEWPFPLQPQFFEIGAMNEYADLVCA